MSKPQFLRKLAPMGVASLSAIAVIAGVGIAAAPSQAADFTQNSSIGWTGGTSNFLDDAVGAIESNAGSFSVTFDPSETATVQNVTGDFVPLFPGVPDQFPTNSPSVTFDFLSDIDTPPGFADAAEFEIDSPLNFEFTSAGDTTTTLTLPTGSIFTAELDLDGGVEVELDPGQEGLGEWFASLPSDISDTAVSSTLTFDETTFQIGGQYSAGGSFEAVPEPTTILGLLAVGGLGLGLKRKKQVS